MSWFSGNRKVAGARTLAPLARTQDLIVEDFSDEVLIYDQRNDKAHCLSRDAAMVWRVCDGQTSPADLATALNLESDVVVRALQELEGCGLLDTGPTAGITRREATMKMAKAGGAVAAAPLIYSILAPTPALAASQNFCIQASGGCSVQANGKTGCDACYSLGCACCGAGTSGSNKLCTADCSPCNCTAAIVHAHCGGSGTQSSCTSGPNHLPTTC